MALELALRKLREFQPTSLAPNKKRKPSSKELATLIRLASNFAHQMYIANKGEELSTRAKHYEKLTLPRGDLVRSEKAIVNLFTELGLENRFGELLNLFKKIDPNNIPYHRMGSTVIRLIYNRLARFLSMEEFQRLGKGCHRVRRLISRGEKTETTGSIEPHFISDHLRLTPIEASETAAIIHTWYCNLHRLVVANEQEHLVGTYLLRLCNESRVKPEAESLRNILTQNFSEDFGRFLVTIQDAAEYLATAERLLPDAGPALRISSAERQRLLDLKKNMDPHETYVGESTLILKVFNQIEILNRSPNRPVLLLGPRGAGKSEIAELIHYSSPRRDNGYERVPAFSVSGSNTQIGINTWTGIGRNSGIANAGEGTLGLLEKIDGGTIFLDDLDYVPLDFQPLLCDVIDGERMRKPGEGEQFVPNVRLIFATSANPDELANRGTLGDGLFRRLRGRGITIPSLCDRLDDVPMFIHKACKEFVSTTKEVSSKKRAKRTSNGASDEENVMQNVEEGESKFTYRFLLALWRHSWPGNVAELIDVLQRTLVIADGNELDIDHLDHFDDAITKDVKELAEIRVKNAVYAKLVAILQQQGFSQGQGLQARMAKVLNVDPARISNDKKARLWSLASP